MSRPLSFVHLTSFYPPYSLGGDAMYIYRLAHALGDLGHQVDVVHCVDSFHLLHPAEPQVTFAEHPRVRRHELRSGLGWISPLLTQQTGRPLLKARAIREVLRERRPDVIQFHNASLLGPTALAMEPPNGRAIKLYMAHEHWLVCATHALWKFNRRPCEKPECLRCVLMAKRPPQLWRYTRLLERCSRHVDLFVTASHFASRMHADRGFPYPVEYLPYFVDRADDDWKQPGPRPQESPYFLFVGRIEKLKGIHRLVQAWNKVQSADLLVAGGGSFEAEAKALAAANPRVKFLGIQPQKDLGNLYFHAVATIVPSTTFETFGIIILESFARRAPVIVHDLGALPEVARESGGGLVYSTESELLAAIDELATSPTRRDELGDKGYRAFIENWSREAHLPKYFDHLEQASTKKFGEVLWKEGGA